MRDHRRATIYDVARAAGVSHQTISNVLHLRGRVGTDTPARVNAAITELDYRPRSAGTPSLSRRRTAICANDCRDHDRL